MAMLKNQMVAAVSTTHRGIHQHRDWTGHDHFAFRGINGAICRDPWIFPTVADCCGGFADWIWDPPTTMLGDVNIKRPEKTW